MPIYYVHLLFTFLHFFFFSESNLFNDLNELNRLKWLKYCCEILLDSKGTICQIVWNINGSFVINYYFVLLFLLVMFFLERPLLVRLAPWPVGPDKFCMEVAWQLEVQVSHQLHPDIWKMNLFLPMYNLSINAPN